MERVSIPPSVLSVAETLLEAGFEAYFVGGCVRDSLIGKDPQDWDVTTNATPEQIQPLFEETFYENDYGTVGIVTDAEDERHKVVEVTPYRVESEYSDARRPDSVQFSEKLEDDLKRRDFTVNALAYHPRTKEIVDLHEGTRDLERRVIACVGAPHERFSEDALRILRAIRLSAELDFTIETETLQAISKHANLLSKISKERIRDELTRIILSPRPMQALFVAQKLGVLSEILPELEEGIGSTQNQAHSFDVFEHTLRTLQHAADKNEPLEVRLAALFHDIGKPATRHWSEEKKDWTFYGHEVVGARITRKTLQNLRFSKEIIETVTRLVRWHMFFSDPDQITLSAVRRIIKNVGQEHIWGLLHLRMCDRIGTGRPKEQPFRLRKYTSMVEEALRDPISVGMLAIDGARIMNIAGENPGPRIGWILHALLEEVLDDPQKNTPSYLEKRAVELSKVSEIELETLGKQGKVRQEEEDEAAIRELREKHHVR